MCYYKLNSLYLYYRQQTQKARRVQVLIDYLLGQGG